jgi:hypothetical protein
VAIWQGLRHENVLPLLGITLDFGRYMSFVSPWLANGSLIQYLERNGGELDLYSRLQLVGDLPSDTRRDSIMLRIGF